MAIESRKLEVEGMSCGHCAQSIKKNVSDIQGVSKVDVDMETKTVTVDFDPGIIEIEAVVETIEDQGYEVIREP